MNRALDVKGHRSSRRQQVALFSRLEEAVRKAQAGRFAEARSIVQEVLAADLDAELRAQAETLLAEIEQAGRR